MNDYQEQFPGITPLPEPLPDLVGPDISNESWASGSAQELRATVPEAVGDDSDGDIEEATDSQQPTEFAGALAAATSVELSHSPVTATEKPEPGNLAEQATREPVTETVHEEPAAPEPDSRQSLETPVSQNETVASAADEPPEQNDQPPAEVPEVSAEPAHSTADEPAENVEAAAPPDIPPTVPPELPVPGAEEPQEGGYQLRRQETEFHVTYVNESHPLAEHPKYADIGEQLKNGIPPDWEWLRSPDSPELFFTDSGFNSTVLAKVYSAVRRGECMAAADRLPPDEAIAAESLRAYGDIEYEVSIAPAVEHAVNNSGIQRLVQRHGFGDLSVITPLVVGRDHYTGETFSVYPFEHGIVPSHFADSEDGVSAAFSDFTHYGTYFSEATLQAIDAIVAAVEKRMQYEGIEPYNISAANIMITQDLTHGQVFGSKFPVQLKLFNIGQFVRRPGRRPF